MRGPVLIGADDITITCTSESSTEDMHWSASKAVL
jgi:hypothetical protein